MNPALIVLFAIIIGIGISIILISMFDNIVRRRIERQEDMYS